MTWQHPLVLALIPAALAAAWWLFRARRASESATRFPHIARLWADRHGLHDAPARTQRRARGAALAVAAMLALAALARPQWGEIAEPRMQRSREVMLALDLSRSMLADDVSPTRLDRAKLLIDALLDQLKGERVGLTVFAGTAFVQSPLSADYEVLRELLAGLDPTYLPQGGSNYGAMLDAASEAFGAQGDGDRYLVVLSDGEAHDESWQQHIAALRERGIRVIGLGIGTPQGALVPAADGGVTKDAQGNAVLSKLEPATLQALASATNGAYRDAATWVDIAELVGSTVALGQKGDYVEQQQVRLDDRFQWFLAPALLLFLFSYWFEFPLFQLARAHQTRGRRPHRAAAPALAAALAGLAAWNPSQAHAATTDLSPPPRSAVAASQPQAVQPNDLAATIAELSDRPALAPTDYARLASDTIGFVSQPNAPRDAQRDGVIDDALAAVTRGEQADAQAADWATLRQQLEALRHPPEPPPSQQQDQQKQNQQNQEQQGEPQQDQQSADSNGSSGEQGEQQDQPQTGGGSSAQQQGDDATQQKDSAQSDKQNGANGSTQSQSGSDDKPAPQDQAAADDTGKSGESPTGETEQKDQHAGAGAEQAASEPQQADQQNQQPKNGEADAQAAAPKPSAQQPKPLEAAGLGSEPKQDAAQKQDAPTKLVGGGQAMAAESTAEAEAEAQGDVALADALGRMRQVKQGDAPAVLFDRMNRAEGRTQQRRSQQDW